jgi:thiol-disulfide isomerase/thioredoxin
MTIFIRLGLSIVIFVFHAFSIYGQEETIELWNYKQLEEYISIHENEKLKVINFWATWCAPCIKEIPYFEEAGRKYEKDIEILLVSLDFSEDLQSKVGPMVKRKNVNSKVVILTDSNYNEWIDKIDNTWTGAIPATLIITTDGKRRFYESELEKEELFSIIDEFKPNNNR